MSLSQIIEVKLIKAVITVYCCCLFVAVITHTIAFIVVVNCNQNKAPTGCTLVGGGCFVLHKFPARILYWWWSYSTCTLGRPFLPLAHAHLQAHVNSVERYDYSI